MNVTWRLLVILPLLASCEAERIYSHNASTRSELEWLRSDTIEFHVNIPDTSVPYSLSIRMSGAGGFPYKKVLVEMHTLSPSGHLSMQLHEIAVDKETDPSGDSNGKWFVEQQLGSSLYFPETGIHVYKVVHGMPVEMVPLIAEVGLDVRLLR